MPKERYQTKVRALTEKRVLFTCARLKHFTANTLAKALKISLPTINAHLESFQTLGYIKEVGSIGSDLGRKSRLWKCLLLERPSLAMEIDIRHIRMALCRLNGEILFLQEWEISVNTESFLAVLEEIVPQYIASLPKGYNTFSALGISVPGDVSFDRKTILFATNLGITGIDIRTLEESLQMSIFLENEANAGALGEIFLSDDTHNDNMLFISISEKGVGGGLIIEGKLQKGMRRKGGEIGHMSIDLNGIPCSCGSRGCLERYTSLEAFEKKACKKGFSLDSLFQTKTLETRAIILEYSHFIGMGIRNLLSIFDPAKIVVGGPISLHWESLYPFLHQEIFHNNLFYNDPQSISICAAKHRAHSSLYGAAMLSYISLFYEQGRLD